MGKTIKSKLKCVPPRLADIKDINVNMSGEVDVEIRAVGMQTIADQTIQTSTISTRKP